MDYALGLIEQGLIFNVNCFGFSRNALVVREIAA